MEIPNIGPSRIWVDLHCARQSETRSVKAEADSATAGEQIQNTGRPPASQPRHLALEPCS